MNKGLIIKKHYLDKILDEGKVWEMRGTRTKVRGKILLIQSGSGLIVGEAELIGCSQKPINNTGHNKKYHMVDDLSLIDKWKFAWILKNAKRYDKPIPYDHPQGAVIWVNL